MIVVTGGELVIGQRHVLSVEIAAYRDMLGITKDLECFVIREATREEFLLAYKDNLKIQEAIKKHGDPPFYAHFYEMTVADLN